MLKKAVFGGLAALVCFVLILSLLPGSALAAKPLDRIDDYEITVLPREDGTLDIRYDITWTVLDSTAEGPLEWVKVGIPNMHADEITALTDNVKKARYYADGGAYVRLDLDRGYKAGEQLTFSFSIHQSHMFTLGENSVTYNFTPGWFDDIAVSRIVIRWPAADVASCDTTKKESGMWVWTGSLAAGEKLPIQVIYSRSAFPNLNPEDTYSSRYMPAWKTVLIVSAVAGFIAIIVLAAVLAERNADSYAYYRGFTGGSTRVFVGGIRPMIYPGVGRGGVTFGNDVGRSSSGGGSSCACACACACAGGGRAGCSRKDFYGTKLTEKAILRALEKKDA